MKELVFVLEERSAAEMLKGLVPRLVPPDVSCEYIVFEGKQDLENNVEHRLKHYRKPYARFIVLRDQDHGDCRVIKDKLLKICDRGTDKPFVVRVACRELESWYLAQLTAVEKGLGLDNLARLQERKYRSPDTFGSPCQQLETITGREYRKVDGSRTIGQFLDPDCERSTSFKHFVAAVRRLTYEPS
jgi:hypothetical protein